MARDQIALVNAPIATGDNGSSTNSYAKRDGNADLTTRRFITPAGGGLRNFGDWHRSGFAAAKTTTYTVADGDDIVYADAASGGFTINLPAAASNSGKTITIVKTTSANTVTIDASGAETINGATTLALTTQYTAKTLHCDGTQWFVIASA